MNKMSKGSLGGTLIIEKEIKGEKVIEMFESVYTE